MSLDFAKNNRSLAFNPTSAFPLDARSYFESYALAAAAAATAEPVASTNTQYYFGQQIAVVENNIASFYIIQPDKTLSKVGADVEINPNVFEYIDGKLNLFGFAAATAGAQLTKDSSGKLSWIAPSGTTVEGLDTALQNLRKDLDDNYFTKEETNAAIAAAPHLKRKIVDTKNNINLNAADADQYIYMVPSGLEEADNKYYEYIVIETKVVDGEGIETVLKSLERVGSWEVDLDDYATKQHIEDNYVKLVSGKSLVDNAQIQKLLNLSPDAEPNIINSVDDNFNIIDKQLKLVSIPTSLDLSTNSSLLQTFVQKTDSGRLISNDEITKLFGIETNAEKNKINDVSAEFDIDENRKLSLISVDGEKIINLANNTEFKLVNGSLTSINGNIKNITSQLEQLAMDLTTIENNYMSKDAHNKDINDLWQHLIWHEL